MRVLLDAPKDRPRVFLKLNDERLTDMCMLIIGTLGSKGREIGYAPEEAGKPIVAISSLGQSCCKYVSYLKPALEQRGYGVLVFHAVGMGGRALESLVGQGRVSAVLDLVAIEVSR